MRDLTVASNNCGVDDFGLGLLLATGRSEDDLELCRREQGIRAAAHCEGDRGGAGAAGHSRGAAPRRGSRHPGLLHRHRSWYGRRGEQGSARVRGPLIRARARDPHRLGHRQGMARRPVGQSAVPPRRAQLQSAVRDGGPYNGGGSRRAGRGGRDGAGSIHTPGIFVRHVVVGRHEKRIERRTTRPNIV